MTGELEEGAVGERGATGICRIEETGVAEGLGNGSSGDRVPFK